MDSEVKHFLKYVTADYIATNVGWFAFTCQRYEFCKEFIMKTGFNSLESFLHAPYVILGQIVIPIVALLIFYLSGFYLEIFRKTRTGEFISTFLSTAVIMLIAFFTVMVNDLTSDRTQSYEIMMIMWCSLFIPVYFTRLTLSEYTKKRIKKGKWAFNTLIAGNNAKSYSFINNKIASGELWGYRVKGILKIPTEPDYPNRVDYPVIEINEVESFCQSQEIKEIIIIPENSTDNQLLAFINSLLYLGINIKFPVDNLENFTGKLRLSPFIDEPLVNVGRFSISNFEIMLKRITDIVVACLALIVTAPVILISIIAIKCDSKGSAFYTQDRVGYRNKPFKIYKLRTMREDAESNGPQLSHNEDPRVTRVGNVLRKYRIDELPQFINVLKGEMSLVGPRPERQYYIDKIMQEDANYALLHSIRPGITSLGMVKYGYASTIEQMVKRMKYDILYIQNMSYVTDMRIIFSTVFTVIKGKGI
ncbi:MAG: sugar transferase [Muribaculaceae bacterium]|nr:sugar transferase [Muribaculaceae bacterium]